MSLTPKEMQQMALGATAKSKQDSEFDWSNASKPDGAFDWASASAADGSAPEEGATDVGSKFASLARGAIQAGTLGFGDEIVAGVGSIPHVGKYLRTPISELIEKGPRPELGFKDALAEVRGDYKKSHEENPKLYTGAEIATALAMPGPGKAKGATLLTRALKAAGSNGALGAAYGLGNSEASIADGEVGQAAKDMGKSALLFGAMGGLGQVGGEAAGGVAKWARKGGEKAADDATVIATKAQDKAEASARGVYRSGVQASSRDLEVMAREAELLPNGPLKDSLKNYLQSEEGLAVREMVAGNKLKSAPDRIGEMNAAKSELESLTGAREENIAKSADDMLANPIKKQVLPRARLLANRLLPPLIGAAGGALLGDGAGAAAGGTLGTALSLIQGRPGTVIQNMVRTPGFRKMAYGALEAAAKKVPNISSSDAEGTSALLKILLSEPESGSARTMGLASALKGDGK